MGNAISSLLGSIFIPFVFNKSIELILISDIYLNGKQMILNDENFEIKKKLIEDLNVACEKLFKHEFPRLIEESDKSDNKSDENTEIDEKENIRRIFGDLVPEDTVMLEINEFNSGINLFSQELYSKCKNGPKLTNMFNDFKILEKNESFNIIQYPQIKENNYYSILLIGNEDINYEFICGFINFLFDINYEDRHRLKIESSENKKDFIISYLVKSTKCNFKFICININIDQNITPKIIEEISDILKTEKINLFAINIKYEDRYKYESFTDSEINYNNCIQNKDDIFFINDIWIFSDRIIKENEEIINNEEKALDYVIKTFEQSKKILHYGVFSFNNIFSKDKNNCTFCKFNLTMESYSKFYKIVTERENKILDFSVIKYCLPLLNQIILEQEKIDELQLNIRELENKKELLMKKFENSKKDKEKITNDFISNIKCYEKNINANPYFLIPLDSKNEKEYLRNEWVNICSACKTNCHLNCKDLCQHLCKCMDWTLKCKNCPNKCGVDSHNFSRYKFKYKTSSYKSIDVLIKEYLNLNTKRPRTFGKTKVQFFIDEYKKKQDNEVKKLEYDMQKQIENIDLEIKVNTEKTKVSKDIQIKTNETIDKYISGLNEELQSIHWYESLIKDIIYSKMKFKKD